MKAHKKEQITLCIRNVNKSTSRSMKQLQHPELKNLGVLSFHPAKNIWRCGCSIPVNLSKSYNIRGIEGMVLSDVSSADGEGNRLRNIQLQPMS